MTLKTRNRSIMIFNIFSIICLLGIVTLLIYSTLNNSFYRLIGYKFFSSEGFSLFHQSDKAVILGLLFLQFFLPIASFHLFYNFEKTQSPLIILFCLYLFSNQLEISRILILLLDLKQSFSQLHLFLGNLVLLGKLISLFSFFLFAINSKESQKLNIEIDIFILLTVCICVTIAIPLNNVTTSKTFGIHTGYSHIIFILYIITFLLTVGSFVINYFETENKALLKLLHNYILIISGKFLITETNILILTISGICLVSIGTFFLLRALHKIYSW